MAYPVNFSAARHPEQACRGENLYGVNAKTHGLEGETVRAFVFWQESVTCHDKERSHFKTLILGAQALSIIVLVDIDFFLRARDHV